MLCTAAWMLLLLGSASESPREELAKQLEPVLARPPATGLLVFEVLAESQAAKLGVRVGDILTHYDGQTIASTARLEDLARKAAREGRGRLLVVFRRGETEIDGEFDAAPLGVRLVAVQAGQGRVLWRPATEESPRLEAVRAQLKGVERWELLTYQDKPIGWVRSHVASANGAHRLRVQSMVRSSVLTENTDVTITFLDDNWLSPTSIRLLRRGKLALALRRENGQWVGERAGVPVTAACPADTVAEALVGMLAMTMPAQPGACRRFALLETSSLSAAPFADLYCVGRDPVQLGRERDAYRYELAVFGERRATYWVSPDGSLLQAEYPGGIRATLAPPERIREPFPDCFEAFPPITEPPKEAAQAN